MSAYFLLGDTKVSNIGFTKVVYCVMTPPTLLPLIHGVAFQASR